MNVIIINSQHGSSVASRVEGFNQLIKDDSCKIDLRIGELVELIAIGSDEVNEPDVLRTYGPELYQLVEDIMNKFTKLNHTDWFKDIYLVPDSGGMVLIIR